VRDVVAVLPRIVAEPACAGRVFNLGSDASISIASLAELVCRTLNSSSPIVRVPYEEAFGVGFDDLRDRRPDISRIRQAVGFAPAISLEQTIRDLADDFRATSHRRAAQETHV
jgi:UDP-glucose 4-epimerase